MPSKLKTQPTEKPSLLMLVIGTSFSVLYSVLVEAKPEHEISTPRLIVEMTLRSIGIILLLWYLYFLIMYVIIPQLR